jgi:hypothetical protein
MKWLVAALAASQLVLAGAIVSAQPADDQLRSAARSLTQAADAEWDRGEYQKALELFTRAHDLIKALPLTVRQADCLVKLGRWVEASEKYIAASRVELGPGDPSAYRQAVARAAEESRALRTRLPKLRVAVRGGQGTDTVLTVDAKSVPTALWDVEFPVDPGEHQVLLSSGKTQSKMYVTVQEGESKNITMELPPEAGPATPAATAATTTPQPRTTPPPAPKPVSPPKPIEPASNSQRTWGWVGLGVGAAGAALSGVATGLAWSKKSSFEASCREGKCPSSVSSAVDAYDTYRTLSMVGLGVGIVGVATGVVLLMTAPRAAPQEQAAVTGWVGLGSAGVQGVF